MSNKRLTGDSPEALEILEALGITSKDVISIAFSLEAGEAALVAIIKEVLVTEGQAFARVLSKYNLVPIDADDGGGA